MFHVAEAMVRWMAPILSFTADEIWHFMPARGTVSPLFETWYQALAPLPDDGKLDAAQWQRLLVLREAVNQSLEPLRKDKRIGSGLDAEIDLYVSPTAMGGLSEAFPELRFLLMVSAVQVHTTPAPADAAQIEGGAISFVARVSDAAKCARCWHHRGDVGAHALHPGLCGRCVENVEGSGESRLWF